MSASSSSALAAPALKSSTLMALPTVASIFEALTLACGLTPRASQTQLAEFVRSAVALNGVCCIEAPTGTGKTLGYLAGALDAQAHSGQRIPIVVATATVGLQEQIIRHDIPRLAAVGAIDPRKVAVAKGRGRYFCPRTAGLLEDKKMQDTQSDLFNSDKCVAAGGVPIALDMLRAWRAKEWDGDRDNWPGTIPGCWAEACGASSDTCVNRACELYDQCPYMESRTRLAQADLIIANHDIVLADLALRSEDPGSCAIPLKNYALIVDEAHNFPDKAVNTKRATAKLFDTDWLRKLEQFGERVYSAPRIAKALDRSTEFSASTFSVGAANLIMGLESLSTGLIKACTFDLSGHSSWGLKLPEPALLKEVLPLGALAFSVQEALRAAAKAYAAMAEDCTGADKSFAVRQLAETHRLQRFAVELYKGLATFCDSDPLVRWATRRRDNGLELHTQPLEGRDVLNKLLWDSNIPVVMVSATLQISGSFERFRSKTGLPKHAVTGCLAPVFDYSRGYLHQPVMPCAPAEPGFNSAVANALERLFNKNLSGGMLVLFTSRDSMQKVADALPAEMRSQVLVQNHRALPELIAQHRQAIDSGRRSILMGLDSMAEGLDLPGKYCTHVVITRLPFAVPGDPVEAARKELLAEKWFDEAYLADMLTMLIQSTGRLIRRESDHGVITLLDNRLATKRYGQTALEALPNFSRGTLISGYLEMAKAKGFDLDHGAAVKAQGTTESSVAPTKLMLVCGPIAPDALPLAPAKPFKALLPKLDGTAALFMLAKQPLRVGKALAVSDFSSLNEALRLVLKPEVGPFADDEVPYFTSSVAIEPCLPAGTPLIVWTDRLLPQATLLGLGLVNGLWSESSSNWQKALALRPDLLQFAQILRSHDRGLLDERRSVVSRAQCEVQLNQGFAGLGLPDIAALLAQLDSLEHSVAELLRGAYKVPTREVLSALAHAGQEFVRHCGSGERPAYPAAA